MDELRELYQQVILEHNKKPRNFGALDGADHQVEGYNPLCGDQITVYITVDDENRLTDVSFEGSGCAISKASASMMTEAVKGQSAEEIEELVEAFVGMVTGESDTTAPGKLSIFSQVKNFPTRVKCATLAWHAVRSALEGTDETVTTE